MTHMNRRSFGAQVAAVAGGLGLVSHPYAGAAMGQDFAAPDIDAMAARGVAFLKSRQDGDGMWSADKKEPGITALVVAGLLKSGRVSPSDPVVKRGLDVLAGLIPAEGAEATASHANYAIAVALMALQMAADKGDARHAETIAAGKAFLKSRQWDEGEGKTPADPFYGGAGYGGRSNRPDLSNTAFMLQALRETGVGADDPAMQKAIVFVSRCQNLDSEFNDQPWAKKQNDGGFVYTAANGGSSVAGKTDDGGLKSYGSMTYSGLKSLIYAGLTPDDPRVKAALGYIGKHYTLDENPGLDQSGLYYYYHAFAKTLALLGKDSFTDADGKPHDWRVDLASALAKRQAADGSWVNPNDRFMEGDPNLVTAYALLALGYLRDKTV
jgi:squalene-hopene/tetraprenyl-beta-curcumene cyclase